MTGKVVKKQPSDHLLEYLRGQNININMDAFSDNPSSTDPSGKEEFNLDSIMENQKEEVESSTNIPITPIQNTTSTSVNPVHIPSSPINIPDNPLSSETGIKNVTPSNQQVVNQVPQQPRFFTTNINQDQINS